MAKVSARPLAPGVMVTVEPDLNFSETVSRHDVVELLAVDPNFDWAKDVTFRHDIWGLEFHFKPLRYVRVDIPISDAKMQNKLIRYLVYAVRNTGQALRPKAEEKGTFQVETVNLPIRFIPTFTFEIAKSGKSYPNRCIPLAMAPIQRREGAAQKLLTSEEISSRDIAVGETVWGVATWEDVDPRFEYFSIYVEGLTNAYEWKDEPGAYKAGAKLGTGRKIARKMLKLNFWRPGDEHYEHEDEIRYPAPGQVDYEWVYR